MVNQTVIVNDQEREMLLRQYLSVAGAVLGEDRPPEALV
jgi:hypothetical protein